MTEYIGKHEKHTYEIFCYVDNRLCHSMAYGIDDVINQVEGTDKWAVVDITAHKAYYSWIEGRNNLAESRNLR